MAVRREPPALSGRFLMRVPATVHARLRAEAHDAGLSLNELALRRLQVPGPALLVEPGAAAALERALALFGDRLTGIVGYGSYARGDATPSSDVDLLIVIDPAIALTRSLYRDWDVEPVRWDQRIVDPHFVHLPGDAGIVAGAWSEAAVDGVVLFERNGRVTRPLAAGRAAIAAGRLVRRLLHGQPYWTEVA